MTFNWLAPPSGPQLTEYLLEAGSAPGLANLATMRLGPATTFVINNVPNGTYHVRVRAANSVGSSQFASNDVVVTSTPGGVHCTPVEIPGPISFRATGACLRSSGNHTIAAARRPAIALMPVPALGWQTSHLLRLAHARSPQGTAGTVLLAANGDRTVRRQSSGAGDPFGGAVTATTGRCAGEYQ